MIPVPVKMKFSKKKDDTFFIRIVYIIYLNNYLPAPWALNVRKCP